MKFSSIHFIGCGALLCAGAAVAQDVAKVSPGTSKVLVENQYVRVIQATSSRVQKKVFTHIPLPGTTLQNQGS